MIAPYKSRTPSSCAVICRVGVLWLEAIFTIAAQMVYTQPCA